MLGGELNEIISPVSQGPSPYYVGTAFTRHRKERPPRPKVLRLIYDCRTVTRAEHHWGHWICSFLSGPALTPDITILVRTTSKETQAFLETVETEDGSNRVEVELAPEASRWELQAEMKVWRRGGLEARLMT